MSDQTPEVNAGRRRKSSNRPTTQAQQPVRRPAGSTKPSAKPTQPSYPSGSSASGSSGLGGLGGLLGGLTGSGSSGGSGGSGGLGGLTGSSGSRRGRSGGIIGIIILIIVLYFLVRGCQGGPLLSGTTGLEAEPTQNVPFLQNQHNHCSHLSPVPRAHPGRQL